MKLRQSTVFPMMLILSLLTLPSIFAPTVHADTASSSDQIQNARQQFNVAFKAVQDAGVAGADVHQIDSLTERLNSALSLIDQAEQGSVGSDSLTQANTISQEVAHEANQLTDAASTNSLYVKIIVFISVPVAAFLVTWFIYTGLKKKRPSEIERLKKMELRSQ
jgi:hypothetical protein